MRGLALFSIVLLYRCDGHQRQSMKTGNVGKVREGRGDVGYVGLVTNSSPLPSCERIKRGACLGFRPMRRPRIGS
jgi:hypothetical protein